MNKSLFGVDCLGCGMQRAVVLILKGEFSAAFYMFPPVYTTLILMTSIGLHFIDKTRNYHKIMASMAIINGIIMVISYIYKLTHY
ncbi:DUF2752 domain-containing protein [Flavobacterium sp.]|uniref:DUF2752 domain-containing protein n=1 Tax=Flavobacterium sp. TaxID=239 RepID=UPI0026071613|nr:DUF2752 domain-containing protein [Flavobacterium sp.]